MLFEKLTDYFTCAAAKYLSKVDSDKNSSNQHEIGGLIKAGIGEHLGRPNKDEEYRFACTMVYLDDESEEPEMCQDEVTWYDSRRYKPHRRPEYRLYYKDNPVTELIRPTDLFIIALKPDGSLLMVVTPEGTTAEKQLTILFGISYASDEFRATDIDSVELILPIRLLLEDIGVPLTASTDEDETYLQLLMDKYEGRFPKTKEFSNLSRDLLGDKDSIAEPDSTIMDWMNFEERLFRIYERAIVEERLSKGFGENGNDVDEFLSFSLSVQNRRKSRVGHALENHLETLFNQNGLRFDRGKQTENKSKPDFLFPGQDSYKDIHFAPDLLRMLGAKTTCKDRWRQVLAEAERIERKHLITLEAGISDNQTREMQARNLQLIVPTPIQKTYTVEQQTWLCSLSDFISEVKSLQR